MFAFKVSGVVLALVLAVSPALADSPVWRIDKGGQHIYLGGTIHVLKMKDYPLPPAFQQAYDKSDILVLEADLRETKTPEYEDMVEKEFQYPEGTTLKTVLEPETLQAIENHLSRYQVQVTDEFYKFKPALVAMTLSMLGMHRQSIDVAGVDQYFEIRAHRDKKPLVPLESAIGQLRLLANEGEGREDELIMNTLEEIESSRYDLFPVKRAWREGDLSKLDEIMVTPMREENPETYNSLLVVRNNAWMPKIYAMFHTPQVELVLVGAAHLVGPDGLLEILAKRGYRIQQLR